jgi:Zn-dependent protease/CBS domain-containing protein
MRGLQIGSAFGIPIKLDVTFLLILPIFAWLIGSDLMQLVEVLNQTFGSSISASSFRGSTQWIVGATAAVGLFACVLLHEFGHSLVAMQFGHRIESITLWLFGGVASFEEFPENWRQELIIALAGPLVSVSIGVISLALFLRLPDTVAAVQFVIGYLALTNVALAAFNMLPGFPMDGGRVVKALLARRRSHAQATQIAAEIGKVFAIILAIVGIFANLFLIALAFFIYIGASSEAQQTVMKAAFDDVVVGDVMTPRSELDVVAETTSVSDLLEQMFTDRHTGYPVIRDGTLVGMVTLDDARTVKEVERDAYRVKDVMSADLSTIEPTADAMTAMQQMQNQGVGRLPVVKNGTFVGLISRSDLMTAFNIIQSRSSESTLSGGADSVLPQTR